MPQDKFDQWIKSEEVAVENSGSKTLIEGAKVARKLGCVACHTLDGNKLVGPSFKDMAGKSRVVVVNGADKEVIATDDYIRESIFNPNKEIVKGYPSGLMQPYTGQISDEEMVQLMEYFKSLSK
jgi:cytochrome c oxidase subunit 2